MTEEKKYTVPTLAAVILVPITAFFLWLWISGKDIPDILKIVLITWLPILAGLSYIAIRERL